MLIRNQFLYQLFGEGARLAERSPGSSEHHLRGTALTTEHYPEQRTTHNGLLETTVLYSSDAPLQKFVSAMLM
jgi:hypothetical protein